MPEPCPTKQKEIPAALELLQHRIKEHKNLIIELEKRLAPVLTGVLPERDAEAKCAYPGIYGTLVDSANVLNSVNDNIEELLKLLAI